MHVAARHLFVGQYCDAPSIVEEPWAGRQGVCLTLLFPSLLRWEPEPEDFQKHFLRSDKILVNNSSGTDGALLVTTTPAGVIYSCN